MVRRYWTAVLMDKTVCRVVRGANDESALPPVFLGIACPVR